MVYPTASHNTSKGISLATTVKHDLCLKRSLKIRFAFNNSSIQ